MVKTGQQWSGLVVTKGATGALATPSVGPAGALYVNGLVHAAGVSVSGTNPYKWTVTLPALTAGDIVSMYVTATIATIATASVVAEDVSDTNRLSDIDIAATGEVGLNFDNIKAASAPTMLTNITVPNVTSATLAATQNAITWAQQKIVANVANEGALDIANANVLGYGTRNNAPAIGQYNIGSGPGSAGQTNQGIAQGQHNSGATGQQNDGGAVGQYNTGTTYGAQNTGASGQVNVGTAGDGIYASGTDHGIEITGTVSALSDNILAELFTVDSGETSATAIEGSVVSEIADQVWDELLAGHLGVGSTGAALNAAGALGDPWTTPLPGAYALGSAGEIIGNLSPTVFPAGAITFTYTVTNSVTLLPIEGVEVWFSTDNPAVNIVWKGDTDAFGVARDVNGNLPALDVGVYFVWRQKAGYVFTDPDTETVS